MLFYISLKIETSNTSTNTQFIPPLLASYKLGKIKGYNYRFDEWTETGLVVKDYIVTEEWHGDMVDQSTTQN